jgi:S-(hydroxymethyl)glutathione dehydrogenase/alcohol dehydrogenase
VKTYAAVVHEPGKPIKTVELDLDEPGPGEVRIRYEYAGLCHSDVHIARGDLHARMPMVLGHEGAGIIEAIGEGVTRVTPGDHVVCSFIPNCGTCRYCANGMQSICNMGATLMEGYLPGPHFPFTGPAGEYGAMCLVGSFSQWGVLHQNSVVKVDDDLPLDKAVLVGCGVPTGWGAAVNTADIKPGDVAVVFGIGGIGINAVQGAHLAGARHVIAIDPLENKRASALRLGATHAFANAADANAAVVELTRGQMADAAILTPGLMTEDVIKEGFEIIGKAATVVLVALNAHDLVNVKVPGTMFTTYRKQMRGSLFGDCNPTADIPRILDLYRTGHIKLDELITREYRLDQVQQGYDDLLDGENLRGIVKLEH